MVARSAAVMALLGLLLFPSAASAALPGGRAIAVTTSISPDVHLFAEPVVARVDVFLDPQQLDPDRIRVETAFLPYELVRPAELTRRTVGGIVELSYIATLRCLEVACLAPRYRTELGEQEGDRPERYVFRFAPAETLYEHPGGRVELLLQRVFPVLEVVSRINTSQLDAAAQSRVQNALLASTYSASLEPPTPTYRLPPPLLAAGAIALAALLCAFPATLAGRALRARWRSSRRAQRLSPLERALLLVEWSGAQADGEQDRRRALEALADVLEHNGAVPLAEETRTVAWADAAPNRQRAAELAAEARSALTGGHGRGS